MRVAIISPKNRSVYNFRGDLIKEIIAQGNEVTVTGPNNIDVEKIEALGAKFLTIPLEKNSLNPLSDIRYLLHLIKFLKAYQPLVTLGYTIKPVIYGAIAAKLCKVPHIVSMVSGLGYLFVANTTKARILRVLGKLLYRIGFGCANTVIFQNIDDQQELLSYKLLRKEKCAVVNGSGVNMQHYTPTALPKTLTFFMLSRILFSKGIQEYLDAATLVKKDFPQAKFMLLGGIDSTQDALSKAGLQPYIDSGIIDYYEETTDVRTYYNKCSVFVLPSYREGTPRTVLEAMAMKRPIITTDVPGCRGTVIDGKTGFLVPAKNSIALADKMRWFANNPQQIVPMGEQGYAYCEQKYDVNKVNDDMMNLLRIGKH